MSHELYVQALSAMFLFWNGARVLTYLPTIGKLLARETDVRSYSLLSWGSWVLSNGTFALMLLEMSRGVPNQMFWMNAANTLMCLVVSFIIVHRRFQQLRACVSGQDEPQVQRRRLVVWGTTTGILSIGFASAVAYGVWAGQEQRGQVAMRAGAHPALETAGPVAVTPSTAASQPSVLASAPLTATTAAAGARLASNASVVPSDSSAAAPTHSAAPKVAAVQPVHANRAADPNHRHVAARGVRTDSDLFTRVSFFFRHVIYRGHGAKSRRYVDDHP
ncbi:hypothetical protein FAZ95_25770 [Trinickia violacea]|uniref:Uncharacterized protein n=1 Tax=Trinickia violacea TaxID=2571746 RepID=A0A4V1EI53_9BURK|nr:hypothetical protein [Trinickia violacea]QCP52570.1 hypothetical protein FAZ95_25770 [Trinickia violacea]